jgi:hypothetical protein
MPAEERDPLEARAMARRNSMVNDHNEPPCTINFTVDQVNEFMRVLA